MAQDYPKVWNWNNERPPTALKAYATAPDAIGFYELGFLKGDNFDPQYCGRAKGITLRQRLGQHYIYSHNANVRSNKDDLYFRRKVFRTQELAAYVEAVSIAAMEYPWNRRNEWAQHWVLES